MTIILYDLVGRDPKRPFSPHCWKAAMALAHKGLDWRSQPVRFTEVPFIEDGATKTVPLIRDGENLVADSFAIARYLDAAYPDAPSLFMGEAGEAHARFIERWSQTMLHPALSHIAILDIMNCLDPDDQAYFRASREKRFGRTLEQVAADAEARILEFRHNLEPLRSMLAYQPFIGGSGPLFADYIVLGAFMWVRTVSGQTWLDDADPMAAWLERCLDLHGGLARGTLA
jgi:glutathione S-transferase